ncbi:unnamed protein product [Coregonus sp. 'balchen']|nr:unnamed protein product [Coregonus sp. 'balchen']
MCFVIDTVIQFQRSGVVGEVETVEQVLVNGAPLSSYGKDVSGIIRDVLLDNYSESFQQAFEIEENVPNTMTKNHTYHYLRVRECKLDGFRVVRLTDQILVNGNDFLTLDRSTDTWTAEVPQALALKQLWDWDTERMRRERIQLHESCTELMKELTYSEPTTTGDPNGSGHPGGVLGSIVHYPQNATETLQASQSGKGYQVL